MPQAPKDRVALMQVVANAIGWGATAEDVEAVAERLEALGVEFIPSALIPKEVVNPYGPKSNRTTPHQGN